MELLYRLVRIVALAALSWVGIEAALTLQATRATEAALPVALTAQLQPLRASLMAKIGAIRVPDAQPLLDTAKAKIEAVQVPNAQPLLDATQHRIETLQVPDAQPTLDATNAILTDAKAGMDAMYDDINALVQNATVATHGIAVTSDVIAQAAPAMTKAAQDTEEHVAGIAADAHKVADQIAKPKSFWGKVWEVVKIAPRLLR